MDSKDKVHTKTLIASQLVVEAGCHPILGLEESELFKLESVSLYQSRIQLRISLSI